MLEYYWALTDQIADIDERFGRLKVEHITKKFLGDLSEPYDFSREIGMVPCNLLNEDGI